MDIEGVKHKSTKNYLLFEKITQKWQLEQKKSSLCHFGISSMHYLRAHDQVNESVLNVSHYFNKFSISN
jgi:hypothetical protein